MNRHVRIFLYNLVSPIFLNGCAKQEDKTVKEKAKIEKSSGVVSVESAELHYVIQYTLLPEQRKIILLQIY